MIDFEVARLIENSLEIVVSGASCSAVNIIPLIYFIAVLAIAKARSFPCPTLSVFVVPIPHYLEDLYDSAISGVADRQ